MKLVYITNVRIPTPRAQGYAIMKMCSEFAKAGVEVKLFVPNKSNPDLLKDPFDFYKIEKNFDIKKVPSFDFLGKTLKFGRFFYWLDILSFLVMTKFIVRLNSEYLLYTRDFLTLLFLPKKYFICLELHEIPTSKFLFKLVLKKPKLFFVLNTYLKRELIKYGVPENIIHISPSGVEIKDFDVDISKIDARKKLGLPIDKDITVYTGHLYPWKGVDTLAEVAKLMPNVFFLFVGGIEPELSQFVKKYGQYKNIIIKPFVRREIVPIYLKSADILVIPNSAKEKISLEYTSPLKLFEYMASKRPIIASDLPSIREIMNEKKCVFAEPDNAKSFTQGIRKILQNKEFSSSVTKEAFEDVQQYTWQNKTNNILENINKSIICLK